jgi:hypothetical protein
LKATAPETPGARDVTSAMNAITEHVVKIREFKLRPPQDATFSIIMGPDGYLWFTEYRAIVRMSTSGKMTIVRMRPTDSDPGFLTVGPDSNIWASTAGSAPGTRFTAYQIIKVKPDLRLSVYDIEADVFPTNLVNINNELYFGLNQEIEKSGSDLDTASVATIGPTGAVTVEFTVNETPSYVYFWLNALTTPDGRIWLYSYEGYVAACSLDAKCKSAYSPSPSEYVDNLHPDSFAYSPSDGDVYVANGYTSSIYKFSSADKLIKRYVNGYISSGYTALTYCAGDIWVTLGPDSDGRPLFGALTPTGQFEYYALPLQKASYIATAMVCGPDHRLWYLRGAQVGEILSKI